MERKTQRSTRSLAAPQNRVQPTVDARETRGSGQTKQHTPAIWSVGGGKGGVGKSLMTSSLAVCFARRGLRCAVVDADLGGANLHTLLGVTKPTRGLSQLLSREISSMSEAMCETTIPNLWLVSGARSQASIANLKHTQKLKLLRQIRKLDVDHVFLDLGAGSTHSVLDFFLEAEHPILVVTPEPTSIENTYHFLKAAFYRWLGRVAKQNGVREALDRVLAEHSVKALRSPGRLIAAVAAIDPAVGQALRQRAESFAPALIMNMARNTAHRSVGRDIASACRNYLGAEVEYCGVVERDECVFDAVNHRRPVLDIAPNSPFSRDVEVIAGRLLEDVRPGRSREDRTRRIAGSDQTLLASRLLAQKQRRSAPAETAETAETVRRVRRAASRAPVQPVRSPEPIELLQPAQPVALDSGQLSPDKLAGLPDQRRDQGRALEQRILPPQGDMEPAAYLKRCREMLGLSISELSQSTRIFSLRNIESSNYEMLPPLFYLRGLVLQYAQALGIPEAEAVADSYTERYGEAVAFADGSNSRARAS